MATTTISATMTTTTTAMTKIPRSIRRRSTSSRSFSDSSVDSARSSTLSFVVVVVALTIIATTSMIALPPDCRYQQPVLVVSALAPIQKTNRQLQHQQQSSSIRHHHRRRPCGLLRQEQQHRFDRSTCANSQSRSKNTVLFVGNNDDDTDYDDTSNSNNVLNSLTNIRSMGNVVDIESIKDGIDVFDISDVVDNIQGDGNEPIGSRGEIYFVAQAILLLLVVIGGIPIFDTPLRLIGGPGLMFSGAFVAFLAVIDLGSDSLSPFPSPATDGDLKTNGIYSKVRHPMYTSLIMISTGLSILTNSADRLLLTAMLVYLLEVKSNKEEDFLIAKYGINYTEYMEQVPGKFLPADWFTDLPWSKKEK